MRQRRSEDRERRHSTGSKSGRPSSQRGRWRWWLFAPAGVLGVIAVVAVVMAGRQPDIGIRLETLPATHGPPYAYNSRPPTSGSMLDQAFPYGHTGEPVIAEAAVHNMEHGAVVIWYRPGDPALAGSVNRLVASVGSKCVVAGPYADMDAPVAVTAWGRLLELGQFDQEQIAGFVDAYRGRLGPEAGAC